MSHAPVSPVTALDDRAFFKRARQVLAWQPSSPLRLFAIYPSRRARPLHARLLDASHARSAACRLVSETRPTLPSCSVRTNDHICSLCSWNVYFTKVFYGFDDTMDWRGGLVIISLAEHIGCHDCFVGRTTKDPRSEALSPGICLHLDLISSKRYPPRGSSLG